MILDLEVEEINVVLSILGEVPTARGVYPLLMKIKAQGENQAELVEQVKLKLNLPAASFPETN